MKLTRFTDYSLRVLIYLAMRTEERATIREIAKAYDISRHHLMKVVSNLARHGYVTSWRGPGGGIALAVPATEINLAHVIGDMEEDMDLVTCFARDGHCIIEPVCRFRNILASALGAYTQELEKYTLQDLVQNNHELNCILLGASKQPVSASI